MTITQKYKHLIDVSISEANSKKETLLKKYRTDGKTAFEKIGLPLQNEENWLYTDIEPTLKKEWTVLTQKPEINFDIDSIFEWDIPQLDAYLIVFFNGHYVKQHDKELPKELIAGSLAEISEQYPEIVEKYIFKTSKVQKKMETINAALSLDGLFLYIPESLRLTKPIQIINIACGDNAYFINQHNVIVACPDTYAQISIFDQTLSPSAFFVNSLTEIHLENNAEIEFYNIQNLNNNTTHYSSVDVAQSRNSRFHSNLVTLHGSLVRNELQVLLNEPFATCKLTGINLTDGKQHTDCNTRIEHIAANCNSTQLYKGIYDDQATGAFTGIIIVHTDAQHTNAFQSNRNILLTSQAKVNTRPQLEIYADDVKCSHGASTGQLSSEALFYMRTRGIDKNEARMLLMYAFANEIISKIKIEHLAKHIEGLINRRLRGELSRCENCVIRCGL